MLQLAAFLVLAAIHGNTYEVVDVAPGIHTVVWTTAPGFPTIGNATFLIGDRDVVVVDAGISRASAEAILGEIRRRTKNPVSAVIHTHAHTDHTYGAYVFEEAFPGAAFIAHPATLADIVEVGVPALARDREAARRTPDSEDSRLILEALGDGHYVLPNTLVDERLVLLRGKRRMEILFLGPGNTDGDLVVWLPEEKIVLSGDLALTPVPFATDSNIGPWIGTLERLAALGATTYIPGHGAIQRDALFIRDVQSLLTQIREHVKAGIAAGKSVEELQKSATLTLRPESPIAAKIPRPGFAHIFTNPAIAKAYAELAK